MKTKLQSCLKVASIMLLFLTSQISRSQTTPAWVKFTGPSNYQNYNVREVSSGVDTVGNIYTAASVEDTVNNLVKVVLVKYNASGTQQWLQYYTSGAHSSYAVKLLVDKSGNCYVCGYGAHNSTSLLDFMVLKFNNAGTLQWSGYSDAGQNVHDEITCATFDNQGNIIVAGTGNIQGSNWDDLFINKWSTSGVQLWSYLYNNSPVDDEDRALAVTSDLSGNIFVTGSSYGTAHRDIITIKLNSSGTNQWTNRLPHVSASEDEKAYSIATDPSGNVYITGEQDDWITIKYSSSGAALWTNHYTTGDLNRDNIKKVMLGKGNTLIVMGDAFFTGGNFTNMVAFELNRSTGAQSWAANVNIMGSDVFYDGLVDSTQNNTFMTCRIDGPNGTDMGSVGLSSNGLPFWQATYTNPSLSTGRDNAYCMLMDKGKNIILSGVAETRGSNSTSAVDVITLKYSAIVTGINETTKEPASIVLYPNPTKDLLILKHNETKLTGAEIRIVNALGQVVLDGTSETFEQKINVSELPKGVYFIKIQNNGLTATGKFIKE